MFERGAKKKTIDVSTSTLVEKSCKLECFEGRKMTRLNEKQLQKRTEKKLRGENLIGRMDRRTCGAEEGKQKKGGRLKESKQFSCGGKKSKGRRLGRTAKRVGNDLESREAPRRKEAPKYAGEPKGRQKPNSLT